VIVVLAIVDFAGPQSRWMPVLSFAFGILSGPATAERMLREWGFAGSHGAFGVFGYGLTLAIGEIWLAAILWSAAGLVRRRGRLAELAVLSTAIFAGHAALHRVLDQGQALADLGAVDLDRFLVTITVAWAALILAAGVFESTLFAAGPLTQPSKMES
jgi:hypothetical protein